jgi:squalene synthase HpnC
VTWLTPRALRPGFRAIYSFCRWSDDLGDEVGDPALARELLAWWRGELRALYRGSARHPVMIALAETVEQFRIPIDPFEALISAFEQDQVVAEYPTYAQLLDYCRRSANPVGHLVLYLARAFDAENARLADATCTALQLANFWQDVARDLALGRIYLPAEDRRRFGYADADLRALRFTPGFAALLEFEVDRTRELFHRGWPLVGRLPRGVAVDVDLFTRGGLAILDRIEARGYDVLSARPEVGTLAKLGLLARALLGLRAGPGRGRGRPRRTWSGRGGVRDRRAAGQLPDSAATWRGARPATSTTASCCCRPTGAGRCAPCTPSCGAPTTWPTSRAPSPTSAGPSTPGGPTSSAPSPAPPTPGRGCRPWPTRSGATPSPRDTCTRSSTASAMDLEPVAYATFDDLYAYCYRVASAVGPVLHPHLGLPLRGGPGRGAGRGVRRRAATDEHPARRPRGRAARPDLPAPGRPAPLRRLPAELTAPTPSERVRALLAFQGQRAYDYYHTARPLIDLVEPVGRPVLRAIVGIYRALLDEIARRDYDVLAGRIALPPWRKALITLGALAR